MPGLFVTATGTDVGKTYVVAGLIRAGRRAGHAMTALKPVMSGVDAATAPVSDAAMLLDALGEPVTAEAIARVAPWRFAAPLSPDMAAALEGRSLDAVAVVEACRTAIAPHRLTLIEGVGGVMVPLDRSSTILDVVAALDLPVLLVSATGLGAISHCLTAYEVLRARGCEPRVIVLNETRGSSVPTGSTRDTLAAFVGDTPLLVIPRDAEAKDFDHLFATLVDAGPSRTGQTHA